MNVQGISRWFKKVGLVARLHKIDNIAALIPLYLEGTAFTVFDRLDERLKRDEVVMKKVLWNILGQNNFVAYDTLR